MFSTPWAVAVLIVTSSCSSCGYDLHSRSLLFRRPPSDEPCSRSSSRCSSRSSSIGGPDRYADALVGPLPFNDASYDSSGVIPVSTVQSRSRSIAVPLQLVLRAFSLSALSYVSMRVPRTDADDSTADRSSTINTKATYVLMSDEFELLVDSEPIGLGLVATEYKQFSRIVVKSIKEYAPENVQSRVREGMVLIGINGGSIEGSSTLEEVYLQIKNAAKPIRLLFRDPQLFYQLVQGQVQGDADAAQNSSAEPQGRALYTTSLLPRKGQFPQQILSVERINVSSHPIALYAYERGHCLKRLVCQLYTYLQSRRVAVDRWVHTGDTVEVLYQVRVGQSPLLHTTEELQLSPLSGAVLDGASDATMAAAGPV